MKLLYVIHQFFPECHSGTEQYCLAAAREARSRGHEVVILSLETRFLHRDPEIEILEHPYDGFRVPRLWHAKSLNPNDVLRDYENPRVAARFRELVEEVGPDAIHFFHLRLLGSDLLTVADELGVRSVVNLMDFWYLCPRFTLLRADGELCKGPPDGGRGCIGCAYPELANAEDPTAAARLDALLRRPRVQLERLARADAVIAPSRFLADMFADNGFPRDRLTVVPYGLQAGRVRRLPVERPRDPLRIAFAGVLSPWKGPHVLIEAMRHVDEAVKLTIHGRLEEGMFQSYIDGLREAAGDDPRIRFPGPFGEAELDAVMADADLLAVPSLWYENTPFVVLEAFEAGVPVIASDLGGLSEVVEDGVNGFLFEPGSAVALAEVVSRCARDPSILRGLRVEAPGTIADNFDVFARLYS